MSGKMKELKQGKFSIHTAPIYDANGHEEKIDDYTEIFEIRERLETALLEAEKASFAKDVFLVKINHELRTPLNCIVGFSELALEGDISPQTKEYLEKIIENTERLLRIIDNISYMSKTVMFNTIDTVADEMPGKVYADKLEKPVFIGEVLVCEDNLINLRVVVEHLERVGLDVEIAENGQVGVEKVKNRMENGEKPFDLILMDIHMPVMDGIEASQKIFDLGSDSPVIAMTSGTGRDRELYKVLGMNDCLGKPFTPQELWRCLMQHLNTASFERDKNENVGEKPQSQVHTDYVKNRWGEITSAIEAGDITLANRLAHAQDEDVDCIIKTAWENASNNTGKNAAINFYKAIGRITLCFPNIEKKILDDLYAIMRAQG